MTGHAFEAAVDIGSNIALRVTNMESFARRVREHIKHKTLGLIALSGAVELIGDPFLLPFLLDALVLKSFVHRIVASLRAYNRLVPGGA